MKLRSFKIVFPIAFHAEALGVLIAVLPVGVFAASTMNSEQWFPQESPIELASPLARQQRAKLGWAKVTWKSRLDCRKPRK